MRNFDRIKLLLLALLLLSSCSGKDTEDTATETSAESIVAEAVTQTDSETDNIVTDDLPQVDYEGYSFRILGAENDIPMLLVEETNGSPVNDAVFQANAAVEDRLNIVLTEVKLSSWNDAPAIRKSIDARTDDLDLGVCHDITAGNLSLDGLFCNLREIPHLDFTKPWWPSFTVDSLTVNGKMYLYSNYSGYNGLRGTKNMYVNLEKLQDLSLDSPYDMVRNQEWTLDRVIEMTKGIYTDLNGDGERTRDDFYGFAFTGLFYGWLENFGVEAYTHAEDGKTVELTLNNDRTVQIVDTVKGWLYNGNEGVYYKSKHKSLHDTDSYPVIFADGNCLFTYGSLYVLLDELVNADVVYGILPMPLLDETQESYLGVCYDSPMWIPTTVSDMDRTGVVVEAMSIEGYRTILPAYKDVALKNRYTVDKDSAEMLDIIFANRLLSFSYIYGGDQGFQQILNTLIPSDSLQFASYYTANEPKELKRIAEINAAFSD